MRTIAAFLLASLVAMPASFALPPNAPAGLRHGANHHTGDDGFVAAQGREPTGRPDEEKLRMREHFLAVRARLAAGKPTRPEHAAMRARILAHLDDYIAHGITPANEHLPWRTPVFIDDHQTICAVGFLIERTAGRALADKIAAAHRYDFIEDIARDMPEVQAWVEQSGFTLDELGQIQPGYPGPEVLLWAAWKPIDDAQELFPAGPYENEDLRGQFAHKKMEGLWQRKNSDGGILGRGTFHRGSGAWTSFYAEGGKLAEGRYEDNRPQGAWRFYHASGVLAAEGNFTRGQRTGAWKFYYDSAVATPIATGSFSRKGFVTGTWRHYDSKGALLATSVVRTPASFQRKDQLFWSIGYLVDVVPDARKIEHRIHQGSIDGDPIRLDELTSADGEERLYLRGDDVFDRDGKKLVKTDGGWRADDCHWSGARRRAARTGDVVALHGMIFKDEEATCDAGRAVIPARAARISTLVASMAEVRAASPAFVQKLVLRGEDGDGDGEPADLTNVIASSMSLDIEWPHVDGRFIGVYKTLPGYANQF